LLATAGLASEAQAHRLEGEYRVLPDRKVRVEAWFETGDAPKGAKVRVFRPGGAPLFAEPGELDAQGVYVFAYDRAEKLRVVISGEGHRKELTIPATELASPGGVDSPTSQEAPARERGQEFPVKDLLLGITFLLALGAFVLSLRNARRLRQLGRPE
jgi:hypothetical protein